MFEANCAFEKNVYYRVRSADGWFLGLHCLFRLLAGLLWLLMAEPSAK